MAKHQWMIYGASGYTGTLIAEEAVRRGHRPILAGRSQEKLMPLAKRLRLDFVLLDLTDTEALNAAVKGVDLVLNAAGPFVHTSEPLIHACLAGSTHYIDVANEIPVFQLMESRHAEALRRGITLMTGAGFGVTVTNCLAKYVAMQIPDAVELSCASAPYAQQRSAGFTKTVLELLSQGGSVRRDGKLVACKLGSGEIQVPFPDGVRKLVPVPTADLEAAYRVTTIPNVTFYSAEFPTNPVFQVLLPMIQELLSKKTIRNWLGRLLDKHQPRTVTAKPAKERPSFAWAMAVDANGKEFQAWLTLGEGYQFTAASSVLTVEKIIEKRLTGVLTPAEAFGADFVLEIPGVKRYTELPAQFQSKENK